jgi:hypothetical protein
MTKHVLEALLIGLAFFASVHLSTRREVAVLLAAFSVVSFVVGLVLVLNA